MSHACRRFMIFERLRRSQFANGSEVKAFEAKAPFKQSLGMDGAIATPSPRQGLVELFPVLL